MPTWFWLVTLFVVGATIGSFLNVCIYRIPVGKSLIWPPSHCGNCFTPVGFDNIPIIGFLLVGGHCRHCGVRLSLQYPLVELLSAVMAPLGYWVWVVQRHEPLPLAGIYVALVLTLVVVTFIDLRWRIIPDRISYGLMITGPLLSLVYPRLMATGLNDFAGASKLRGLGPTLEWLSRHPHPGALVASLLGLAAAGVFILVIRTLGTMVFGKEAMGLGDAKLLAGICGLLGYKVIPLIFLLAVFIGAVVGVTVFLRTRRRDIPFGPYLAAGAVTVMFFGNPIWKWYFGLMHLTGGEILS